MKIKTTNYKYVSDVLAGLTLFSAGLGFYAYNNVFNPHTWADYKPFNYFHEVIVLLFSGLGIVIGVLNIRKTKKWAVSFFMNVIIFLIISLSILVPPYH